MIRSYGVERLQAMLRGHIALAEEAETWVAAAEDFEITAPRRLALFNFRYKPAGLDDEREIEALNERLLHALNDGGRVYFTQNRVDGVYCLRWSIGQTGTQRRHVEEGWKEIQRAARSLRR